MSTVKNYAFFHNLTALPFVDEIWLHGSRAMGNHRAKSDIDLIIHCPHATLEEWWEVNDVIERADTSLGIDYVRFDTLTPGSLFERNVLAYHKVLFKRDTLATNDFLREESSFLTPPSPHKRIGDKLISVENAFNRLQEMAALPVDETRAQMDSTIQRFEFCIELSWKILKCILNYTRGYDIVFPKETIIFAEKEGIIAEATLWLNMIEDRNKSSHIYKEVMADEIYLRIKTAYLPVLSALLVSLKKVYG